MQNGKSTSRLSPPPPGTLREPEDSHRAGPLRGMWQGKEQDVTLTALLLRVQASWARYRLTDLGLRNTAGRFD